MLWLSISLSDLRVNWRTDGTNAFTIYDPWNYVQFNKKKTNKITKNAEVENASFLPSFFIFLDFTKKISKLFEIWRPQSRFASYVPNQFMSCCIVHKLCFNNSAFKWNDQLEESIADGYSPIYHLADVHTHTFVDDALFSMLIWIWSPRLSQNRSFKLYWNWP